MTAKDQIGVLDFPDNVRLRRDMYIPNPEHNIFEIVDNSVDEFAAGRCSRISVTIRDEFIKVVDDGQGIPVAPHSDPRFKGLSQAEVALTTLHAGGKFGNSSAYKVSGGLA